MCENHLFKKGREKNNLKGWFQSKNLTLDYPILNGWKRGGVSGGD